MTNINFSAVSKRIEQGARDLEWVIDVSKKLKEIGSIEQAEIDTRGRYNETVNAMSELEGKVEGLNKELKLLQAQRSEEERAIKKDLEERLANAEKYYDEVYSTIEDNLAASSFKSQTIQQNMEIERKSLQASLEDERLKLASVQADVKKSTEKLSDTEVKISAAKERARRAMDAYQETFKSEIE